MKRVVEGLLDWLRRFHGEDARVTRWPDLEDRGNPICDAVIDRGGIEMHVEHTRVLHARDEVRVQRLMELMRPALAERLRALHPNRASWIALPLQGLTRRAVRELEGPCVDACSALIGRLAPGDQGTIEVPGLPGPAVVISRDDGIDAGEHVAFPTVPSGPVQERVRLWIDHAVREKSMKHGSPGPPMILILDCREAPGPPLMLLRPVEAAARTPEARAFHELWLAGSAVPPVCFVGPLAPGRAADADTLFWSALIAWDRLRRSAQD